MSDDKFLACLLSNNDCTKAGRDQDSSASPAKEPISCDKNGNFDESTKDYIIDKEARRLSVSSVESSSENPIEEPCNSHTEAEINSTIERLVNNEVDNTSNSTGTENNLENGYSKDTNINIMETLVETSTVIPKVPEQKHSIEQMKATDTLPPQQSQDVSDTQQVQELIDSVLPTIETPCVETTTVASKQQVVEMKSTDNISSQEVQDILTNLQTQQPQTNSNEKGLTYREDVDSSDDDTSSTFSLSSSSDCSDSFLEKMHRGCSPANKRPNIKTKGELDLDELPPIEDLTIDITEREMQKVGTIYAVVDKLVIVRALKDLQPLDLDSVLFLSHKETLGRIFDVFGPVVEPFYSVRFNSLEHIAKKTIVIDADVFFAPEKTDITSYVFVDQLRKQKGSDASWQDNNEPPEEFLDYSDDEEERAARRKRTAKSRNRYQDSDDVQVIPNKVSKGTTPKNSEEINPWVDIKKYQSSLNSTPQRARPNLSQKNPFQRTHMASQAYNSTPSAKPTAASPMSSERYANRGPQRYGTMASQGGTNVSTSFPRPQNVPAPQQNMQPQYPASMQSGPVAVSSGYFPPQHQQFAIQSCLSSPYPQPMVQPPALNFMHQPPMSPHPGLAPNHRFGQVPYFNGSSLPSLMGMPPPPAASPVAFATRPDARFFMNQPGNFPSQPVNFPSQSVNFSGQPGNFSGQSGNFPGQSSNFSSQPVNFPGQSGNFSNQPANFPGQSANFSSQAQFLNRAMNQSANLVNTPPTLQQNSLLGQPGRLQWQNGPPSPYGMTPLSISIPTTPPSNAIYTPVPSPYNLWGSKSLNFPQIGYFGNNAQ
ncbi:hypothetical protein JTE90_017278 [Oedothorax gibbosus]|uniref:H/ACA ribonucleoprotein complex non-core subunit NAF1 n=1 Tax=Oedothorax gibbosus TaxID=931172 RepID=A0AAV6VE03_9ARAC|nr:hypothetical protein JTE90_017278 [Oedothorax gibbosus]